MPNFKYIEESHALEVVDIRSTTFRSEHKFNVEAIVPTRFFIREYTWTGSGSEKEDVPELVCEIDDWGFPQHRIHGPLIAEGSNRILIVDLGRTINAGENVNIVFRHRMKDLSGTFDNRLSFKPNRNIENSLHLQINLPNLPQLRVMYQRFTHDIEKVVKSDRISRSSSLSEAGRLVFEKTIIKPSEQSMGHRLQWQFGVAT